MQLRPVALVAGITCVAAALCLFGAAYLAFVFPRYLDAWTGSGMPLTATEQFAVALSHFVKIYGVLVFPALLGAVVATATWFGRSLSDAADDYRP